MTLTVAFLTTSSFRIHPITWPACGVKVIKGQMQGQEATAPVSTLQPAVHHQRIHGSLAPLPQLEIEKKENFNKKDHWGFWCSSLSVQHCWTQPDLITKAIYTLILHPSLEDCHASTMPWTSTDLWVVQSVFGDHNQSPWV